VCFVILSSSLAGMSRTDSPLCAAKMLGALDVFARPSKFTLPRRREEMNVAPERFDEISRQVVTKLVEGREEEGSENRTERHPRLKATAKGRPNLNAPSDHFRFPAETFMHI